MHWRIASYLGLSAFYQQKRDLLAIALRESRFELLPSAGSFFMLARFRGFSDETRQRLRAAPDSRCARRDDSAVGVLHRRHGLRPDPPEFSRRTTATLIEGALPFVRDLMSDIMRGCVGSEAPSFFEHSMIIATYAIVTR